MESNRLDAFARFFAASRTRRGILFRLAGGILAVLPFARGADDAAAKACPPCRAKKHGKCKRKRPNGTPCGLCRACQGGRCRPLGASVACGVGKTCQNGVCADCIPTSPGSPVCEPGPFNACCSGLCVMQQPDVFLCAG